MTVPEGQAKAQSPLDMWRLQGINKRPWSDDLSGLEVEQDYRCTGLEMDEVARPCREIYAINLV